MLTLTMKAAKGNFFDRKKVADATTKAERKVLSRFGAFVRQRAKTSIRYRKGTSPPGRPPFGHRTGTRVRRDRKTGAARRQAVSPLRELIFFAWDEGTRSVVIGPVLFRPGSRAPALLEYGGTGTVTDPRTGQKRRGTWRARPYMRPAMEAEKGQLPDLWKNSIR